MFTFYDFEVFKHDWMVVFYEDGKFTRIHNDKAQLKRLVTSKKFLVGFNNYHYDDKILAGLMTNHDPYELSAKIIGNEDVKLVLNAPITIDVMQEMKMGVSLKEAEANLGLNVHETPVDFNLDRPLTEDELERTFQYCENDVLVTKELFEKRSNYFTSKFELVKQFSLPLNAVKKTRANLSARALECKRTSPPNDRLHLTYDHNLELNRLPEEIVKFYEDAEHQYRAGGDYHEIEKEKLKTTVAGVKHVYGFGGLHGARENYFYEGNMLHIDVGSYYPSLIINNNFMSRASARGTEVFKEIYDERMRLKKLKDGRQEIYKIILNATFGAMKSKFNTLYDPVMANNICVNGQLILTDLILQLEQFTQLIQSNTDGIVVSYSKKDYDSIKSIINDFSNQYNLSFDIDPVSKIAQRDVNNYIIQYANGEVKAKGRFAQFKGGSFERNSLHIIDQALVNYYIHGTPISKTVIKAYKENQLHLFQLIAKAGRTYKAVVHEVGSEYQSLQKVNRVFATSDRSLGGVFKIKEVEGVDRYAKIPWTSENVLVHNDEIDKFDKRKLDLRWYINLIEGQLMKT